MSTPDPDETSPATGRPGRVRRPRRERGVTETLLSVVLVLEAVILIFAGLTLIGLSDHPLWMVLGGTGWAVAIFLLVSQFQRWNWGVVLGGVLQVGLVATGFLHGFMFVIGAVFAGLWVWCLVRARRIESSRRTAAEGVDG
ncbi:DUF4233 domain-containing protein [Pseudolysinimonas sp.]|uniref:DUF4233 domain-containing protein n=1 Tax=Pseudolysinimonas sp. TaxID=2680009 RepID=UPI0037832EEC